MMYATLSCQWNDIKNSQEYTRTLVYNNEETITYIYRAILDKYNKKIYVTYDKAEPKKYEDDEWLELNIKESYGPYSTEQSLKSALSKVKARIRRWL